MFQAKFLLQVFCIMQEAVKPLAQMFPHNREQHRPTQKGQPFSPLAFGTVEESLGCPLYIPQRPSPPAFADMPQAFAGKLPTTCMQASNNVLCM